MKEDEEERRGSEKWAGNDWNLFNVCLFKRDEY